MTDADTELAAYLANGDMAKYNVDNPDLAQHSRITKPRAASVQQVDARPKRRHKYNAQRTEVDGISFDSKREAQRYQELQMLAAAGEIHALQLQPRFELQPAFKHNGKTIRAIHYVADFQYTENGRLIVEDTKGMATAVFNLKKKLFLYRYPDVELRIIK